MAEQKFLKYFIFQDKKNLKVAVSQGSNGIPNILSE